MLFVPARRRSRRVSRRDPRRASLASEAIKSAVRRDQQLDSRSYRHDSVGTTGAEARPVARSLNSASRVSWACRIDSA